MKVNKNIKKYSSYAINNNKYNKWIKRDQFKLLTVHKYNEQTKKQTKKKKN